LELALASLLLVVPVIAAELVAPVLVLTRGALRLASGD